MSQYSCVVPASWSTVWFEVLGAWVDLLRGRSAPEDFCARFGVTGWPPGEGWAHMPPGYLEAVGWRDGLSNFSADALRSSPAHAAFSALGCAEEGTAILGEAIVRAAALELPGTDTFIPGPDDWYYLRRHDAPRVQVAGTKNRFHFLEAIFNVAFNEVTGLHYRYRSLGAVEPRCERLLRDLFLGHRALPGVGTLDASDAWPAYDDEMIAGYLVPAEVTTLAAFLDTLGVIVARGDVEGEPFPLFDLFVDRVRRSADASCGLVAFDGFL